MNTKEEVIKKYGLSNNEIRLIEIFIKELKQKNKFINLVGKSTIENVWSRHVCDSLQIASYIKDKKLKILDMGTGAGIPGIFLSISGCSKVVMIDSIKKKTDFVKDIILKLNISAKVVNTRLENYNSKPIKYIVSRALAPLEKLISYSLLFSNKDTSLLFLKGRNVNKEIQHAKTKYNFRYSVFKSLSSNEGCVLKINNFKKKWLK